MSGMGVPTRCLPGSHSCCRAWTGSHILFGLSTHQHMSLDPSSPLDPREVDALLEGRDLRTVAADLFALRDSLQRMHVALEQLASTMTALTDSASRAAEAQRRADAELERPPSAPRGD
jgi:hypothetical protein